MLRLFVFYTFAPQTKYKKAMRICFLFLSITSLLSAQVKDDFSDGNFTINPKWSGDTSHFIINALAQLQLNNTASNTSYLSTESNSTVLKNKQWNFFIKQNFSPSANNFGRVYLASDQKKLTGSLNGYYLQFGEAGSADAIELFRQSGLTSTSITRATNGKIATAFNMGIKVTCDTNGNWNLYTDPKGGVAYVLETSGKDTTSINNNYFGVMATYTASNASNFYFDDFYFGSIIVDTIPPSVVSVIVSSNTRISICFTEAVDSITSQITNNYDVNNGIGSPFVAKRDTINLKLVHLQFSKPFKSEAINILTIKNIEDVSANTMNDMTIDFQYYHVKPFDIVINEIMADPDPVLNNLPAFEYIELYNKTSFPISLTNWQLSIGLNNRILPSIIIPSKGFLIITSTTAYPYFPAVIPILQLTSFPALTNTGQSLILKNAESAIISAISYTDQWYNDNNKKEGGWSLEQIDPDNPCGEANNWKASMDSNGGTPGTINSVYKINKDTDLPRLLNASITSPNALQLYFNEPLDSFSLINPKDYLVDNNIGNPSSVKIIEPNFKSVVLGFSTAFKEKTIYNIEVKNSVADCVGNPMSSNTTLKFAIPDSIVSNDIIINEILFNPKSGSIDFVELYNRSEKIIDLKMLRVSEYDNNTSTIKNVQKIGSASYLFFPKEYIVLSENENLVKNNYQTTNPDRFINLSTLPAMNIDEGSVCISTTSAIIDRFNYSEKMHFGLLTDKKGISLERINFNRPTQDPTNWHSAAKSAGYATPGYQNSQFNELNNNQNEVEVSPQLFSPDEDGYNDVVNISYHFDKPAFIGNVTIYDSKGRLVKRLVKNELLATKGTFSWDGINEEREKERLGIYIIFFEALDLSGNIKHYKKICVLGGKI
ncbi:MAG: lamin tail domain-containing protein [Bacteroidia bacterium]